MSFKVQLSAELEACSEGVFAAFTIGLPGAEWLLARGFLRK